jgi:hypothetical protein
MTADFDVCGVRLVPDRVPIADRRPELEDGWLALRNPGVGVQAPALGRQAPIVPRGQ